MNRSQSQRGIALITTLIMLSVVTLMAVAFLAVSRRERAAVTTSTDRMDAKFMAEVALQRAEAEMVARVLAPSNLVGNGLLVSTNFINPTGFEVGNTNIENVSFVYPNGNPVNGDDFVELLGNSQVDPRPPVFVGTDPITGAQEHRYFLDFNRNGRFETNGFQPEIDEFGNSLRTNNFHAGDPEWIGVLQRPDRPHSGANHYVGRYAYLVLPAGKTLDLNFVHNQAKRVGPAIDGFHRNQGVGAWEINLAAFLHELNTNAWPTYLYRTNSFTGSSGIAFDNALTLLRQRYRRDIYDANPSYNRLQTIRQIFRVEGFNAFLGDGIDGYSDGPLQLGINPPYRDTGSSFIIEENDEPNDPWSGADNPFQYFDPQELFSVSESSISPGTPILDRFTNRLMRVSTNLSTYGRHTFYRLLSQLGTDSLQSTTNRRIHLNYDNRIELDPRLAGARPNANWGFYSTNFVAWTPIAFFTNTAEILLKSFYPTGLAGRPNISVTNISVWPSNYYAPSVHRMLQLSANIFDATTNASSTSYPYLPHVFRPIFVRRAGSVVISGYEPLWDGRSFWQNSVITPGRHVDLDETGATASVDRNSHIAGIPLVIGAKKGFPNFNEFTFQTVVQATRKLEILKRAPQSPPALTKQLYTLGISNFFGIEFWNSYTQAFPRPLELRVRLQTTIVLSNETRRIWPPETGPITTTTLVTNILFDRTSAQRTWGGGEFKVPITAVVNFLPDMIYRAKGGGTLESINPVGGLPVGGLFEETLQTPTWKLAITNRIQAMLIDASITGNGRIVDYVDLDNLNSIVDITEALVGRMIDGDSSSVGSFWETNFVQNTQVPQGIQHQIDASRGALPLSEWNSASFDPISGQDREKAIQRFNEFMAGGGMARTVSMQVPFSPARKILKNETWQVNDPLVNDLIWDLVDLKRETPIEYVKPVRASVQSDNQNLGEVNYRYMPWQASLRSSANSSALGDFDLSLKDPQITRSDDWDFPTNAFPAIGLLGRVHRGTPWQTVYLKSSVSEPLNWIEWSGHVPFVLVSGPPATEILHPSTHPTNDWQIVDLFTAAIGENASRGILSVNQSGQAAWSAVLSGVPVLANPFGTINTEPRLIEPNTPELKAIVAGINRARTLRQGQQFNYMGEVLATEELSFGSTTNSPFLVRPTREPKNIPPDAVVERIPQMILSLLKQDESRYEPQFVVYAYGQSLSPAPASVVTDLGRFFQMPTNYTITGEYVTKTLMRLKEAPVPNFQTGTWAPGIRSIKESYNEVPAIE